MEQFSNPDLINSLGLGDKLLNSLLVMVLGMGITFLVLVGLMAFIALLKSFSGHKNTVHKEEIPLSSAPAAPVEKTVLALPSDDDELLAVIAAAIQAQDDELVAVIASVIAMLEQQSSHLKIQSIKRLNPAMPAWAQSGLNSNLRRI